MLSKHLVRTCTGLNHAIRRNYAFFKSAKEVKEFEEPEPFDPRRPIRFSTSPAAHWNIRHIRLTKDPVADAPWYKAVIWFGLLLGSVYYLNYYRERSYIDDEIEMPLGKRVLQIRELQVKKDRTQALLQGLSTAQFDQDLEEIEKLRKKHKYVDD